MIAQGVACSAVGMVTTSSSVCTGMLLTSASA